MTPPRPDIQIHSLLYNLIDDAQEVSVLWQLAVLLASLGLTWLLHNQFKRHLVPQTHPDTGLAIGAGSLGQLLFPLLLLALVMTGKGALNHWYSTHLLNIAIPLLFALVLVRAAVYVLRRVFSGQGWLRPWEHFIGWTVWIALVLHVVGLLPGILAFLDDISFHVGTQRLSVLMIAQGILAFTASMLLALWLASTFETRIMLATALNMHHRVIVSKMIRTLLVFLGILVALPMIGVDVTVLSVFGGALGVGLGFGLQKIASNYISGFIILLDRSLNIGDVVAVDGRKGQVTTLTTRYVVLRMDDGTEALIPNDTFVTSTVVNQTYSDHRLRLLFPVQISYSSPVETAMGIMLEAARKRSQILARPAPEVALKEFAESGINLELIVWVEDPEGGILALRNDLSLELLSEFRKHGIEIPFPQQEVRLVLPDDGEV